MPKPASGTPTAVIAPELAKLAEDIIGAALANRDEHVRQRLYRAEHEAEATGRTGAGYYPTDQQDLCLAEINYRVDTIWNAYRRVVEDGRLFWTDSIRLVLLARIEQTLDRDIPYFEEMARAVITRHGHSFSLFLRDARPRILSRITAEMDLFALHHRPIGASMREQLGAPRYSGPRAHWIRVDRAMGQSPPDFATAAREAVNSVEGLAKILANLPTGTLGECIKLFRRSGVLDEPTAKTFEGLWGFANSSAGFRHGAHVTPTLSAAEGEYVVGSCKAATKLLLNLDAPRPITSPNRTTESGTPEMEPIEIPAKRQRPAAKKASRPRRRKASGE